MGTHNAFRQLAHINNVKADSRLTSHQSTTCAHTTGWRAFLHQRRRTQHQYTSADDGYQPRAHHLARPEH